MSDFKDATYRQLLVSCINQDELKSEIKICNSHIVKLNNELESEQIIIEDICPHDTVIKWTEYEDYYEGRNRTYHKCVICGKNVINALNVIVIDNFSREKVEELRKELLEKWSKIQ